MKILKYIPSRSKHYMACPYFLKLSNMIKIPIDEPHIVGIRRTQLFKDKVIERLAKKRGIEPVRTQRPIDIILSRGLILIAKKLDIIFFSASDIAMEIEMFKPDVIETTVGENIEVNVKSIKNIDVPSSHHYLQAFVYKLALEKALKGTTMKPFKVSASLLYWSFEHYPVWRGENEPDMEDFSKYLSGVSSEAFFSEEKIIDEQLPCADCLQKIATLEPQDDENKCKICVGKFCCDVFNQVEFKDKYKWFSKFQFCE